MSLDQRDCGAFHSADRLGLMRPWANCSEGWSSRRRHSGVGGSNAIGFTVDIRGLAQGVHLDSLDLDGSTGEWSTFRPFGYYRRRVWVRVTDSSARLVPTPVRL